MPDDEDVVMKAIALYDYDGQQDDELTFAENDEINVLIQNDDGWFEGYVVGKEDVRGLFPGNYVEQRQSEA